MQPCHDGLAQAGSRDFSQLRSRPRLVQFLFEPVSVAKVLHEPHGHFRGGLFGVEKFAPHMRQAAREHDLAAAPPGKAIVSLVAVALEGAAEVRGDDALQAGRGAAGFPVKMASPRGAPHVQR